MPGYEVIPGGSYTSEFGSQLGGRNILNKSGKNVGGSRANKPGEKMIHGKKHKYLNKTSSLNSLFLQAFDKIAVSEARKLWDANTVGQGLKKIKSRPVKPPHDGAAMTQAFHSQYKSNPVSSNKMTQNTFDNLLINNPQGNSDEWTLKDPRGNRRYTQPLDEVDKKVAEKTKLYGQDVLNQIRTEYDDNAKGSTDTSNTDKTIKPEELPHKETKKEHKPLDPAKDYSNTEANTEQNDLTKQTEVKPTTEVKTEVSKQPTPEPKLDKTKLNQWQQIEAEFKGKSIPLEKYIHHPMAPLVLGMLTSNPMIGLGLGLYQHGVFGQQTTMPQGPVTT